MAGKTRKSAYWIQRTHLFRADEFICSACGGVSNKPNRECPKCGSRMKKSKYDPSWVDEAETLSVILDEDW